MQLNLTSLQLNVGVKLHGRRPISARTASRTTAPMVRRMNRRALSSASVLETTLTREIADRNAERRLPVCCRPSHQRGPRGSIFRLRLPRFRLFHGRPRQRPHGRGKLVNRVGVLSWQGDSLPRVLMYTKFSTKQQRVACAARVQRGGDTRYGGSTMM
jgi:hypothetical protein